MTFPFTFLNKKKKRKKKKEGKKKDTRQRTDQQAAAEDLNRRRSFQEPTLHDPKSKTLPHVETNITHNFKKETLRYHYMFIIKFIQSRNGLCVVNTVNLLLINTKDRFQEGSNDVIYLCYTWLQPGKFPNHGLFSPRAIAYSKDCYYTAELLHGAQVKSHLLNKWVPESLCHGIIGPSTIIMSIYTLL